VPLERVTHFDTPTELDQTAENNSLVTPYTIYLTAFALNLSGGNLHPHYKCNPDAKYMEK
jgi:hypothetical protein